MAWRCSPPWLSLHVRQDRDIAILRNDMERMNRQLMQMQVSQEVAQSKPRELVQRELEGSDAISPI